ncbi:hypothetical protein [Paenibacillus radicis (ex Xue et al. 2023)]|uniref:Uncharacterized protein n=1 Tax=Paenibacillus radicis (ex Xue et al. 2023) TaxID=2972489 RepID=A0ABT1YU84_9BACL|nr:hypothetical protein [Paenibacillus radicis (ex Xue et al. 2023)]MCR8635565.1 hypothetical protein [Paenibacillus radicis (ex Xue et al. 2023)]
MVTINKYAVMFFSIAFLFIFFDPHALAAPESKAILTVKASTEAQMQTQLTLDNKWLQHISRNSTRTTASIIPVTDTALTLVDKGVTVTYSVDRKGGLYHIETNEMIQLNTKIKLKLAKYVQRVRSAHYGKILPWDKAKGIIPKKKKFKVIDVESGLSFNVQRRAGTHHADVQPLTKEDTAVMKQIYNGKWSWRRKAIIVQTEDKFLAASMHGMPHGGDGIPDNDFSGHFCIHFLGSTTHGSGNVDPEHQLMVYKAGGKLDEYFMQASPYEIVNAYFNAFNFRDSQILKMSFSNAKHHQLELLYKNKDQITGISKRVKTMARDTSGLLSLEIPVEVGITRGGRGEERATLQFQMKRTSFFEQWKIDSIDMIS